MADETPAHPWGTSHSQNHEVADIVSKLDRVIEVMPEEKKKAAIAGIEKAIADRTALPSQILKNVLGALIGAAKPF